MISLSQIEQDLVSAMKAKEQVAVEVLRGLKTRIQNEKVAKTKAELDEAEILALVRNEVKRRKDSAEAFVSGGRQELADKELMEAKILEKYLPAAMPEEDIAKIAEEIIAANSFTAADFGKAMGQLKAKIGTAAEGAIMAKVLKEKLK
ncbi:MAG: GatB/YqeY domain-containing protein [Candidatus Doudnabacteria bacterium]|nr:GatB/YqeY domain-containing protein [Candidatus Doudnabacteria bacterium]